MKPEQTAKGGRAVRSAPQARPGALHNIDESLSFSRRFSVTPPERGHSCPQQLPNAQRHRKVQPLYLHSTLLRTRMSALRFGSGYAGLRIPRGGTPYHPGVTEAIHHEKKIRV